LPALPPLPPPPTPPAPALAGSEVNLLEPFKAAGKGISTALIAVLASIGALLAVLLAALAYCAWRRGWGCCAGRKRQQEPPAAGADEGEEKLEGAMPVLRIRVEKPAHADQAMKAMHAPAAFVATPWRPQGP
jgi:hypothetical protein